MVAMVVVDLNVSWFEKSGYKTACSWRRAPLSIHPKGNACHHRAVVPNKSSVLSCDKENVNLRARAKSIMEIALRAESRIRRNGA